LPSFGVPAKIVSPAGITSGTAHFGSGNSIRSNSAAVKKFWVANLAGLSELTIDGWRERLEPVGRAAFLATRLSECCKVICVSTSFVPTGLPPVGIFVFVGLITPATLL
jgi:hypothetical protein